MSIKLEIFDRVFDLQKKNGIILDGKWCAHVNLNIQNRFDVIFYYNPNK